MMASALNLRASRVGILICLVSVCSAAAASPEPSESDRGASNPPSTSPSDVPETHASQPGADTQSAPTHLAMSPLPMQSFPAPSSPPREQSWYGWQTLIVDGVSAGLLVGALAGSYSNGKWALLLLPLSGVTYVLGAPAVHWGHGNVGKGFASLGLRLGLPIVFGGIGGLACSQHSDACGGGDWSGIVGALYGGISGAATAMALDAAFLAYEPEPESKYSFVVSPVALPGGVGLGSFGTW